MLWNQGRFEELSPECQTCQNRRTFSVYMSGKNTYCCGKYPLKVGEKCPKYDKETQKMEVQDGE